MFTTQIACHIRFRPPRFPSPSSAIQLPNTTIITTIPINLQKQEHHYFIFHPLKSHHTNKFNVLPPHNPPPPPHPRPLPKIPYRHRPRRNRIPPPRLHLLHLDAFTRAPHAETRIDELDAQEGKVRAMHGCREGEYGVGGTDVYGAGGWGWEEGVDGGF